MQVRPPKLGPPPQVDVEESDVLPPTGPPVGAAAEFDHLDSLVLDFNAVLATGGGVRVKPPKLLSYEAHQDNVSLLSVELDQLTHIGLEMKAKPIIPGFDGGYGVKVKPPILRPPGQANTDPVQFREDYVAEESPLLDSAIGDGGGVRVHPPRLLSAQVADLPLASEGEFHHVHENLDNDDLLAIGIEASSAPLERGPDGGGGVRLPPPPLKSTGVSEEASLEDMENYPMEEFPGSVLADEPLLPSGGGIRIRAQPGLALDPCSLCLLSSLFG